MRRTLQSFLTMTDSIQISKNATTAKNGNKAEQKLCDIPQIKQCLESYFGKPIQTISKVPGRKKSDNLVTFMDGTSIQLQNKDGKGNGRGWSADRRSVEKMPVEELGKALLSNVCLKKSTERPVVPLSPTLIADLLLGSDNQYKPTHFTHTVFDKESGDLLHLSISPAETILGKLQEQAYKELVPKKTCVHISPLLYLQRKGGGSKDHAPDDIQLKVKDFPPGLMTCLFETKTQ